MRLKLNKNGYGVAVIQRLCKTSVKKNLYWEIKDKVIEEQFDGTRNIKRTAKVKVYGLDSNKAVRARLIEILYERVRYHKDKFIIPILHQEMCGMQVKKDGRVDHSPNTHDDNVFSYLMALHVWYDGTDLIEKYGIQKNTIKTDEDVEILDGDIDAATEKKAKLDLHELEYDEDDEASEDIREAYKFIEESLNFKTSAQLHNETYLADMKHRDELLTYNKIAREAYCKQNGIDPSTFVTNTPGIDSNIVILPDRLFGGVGDEDDMDLFGDDGVENRSPLTGNLSGFWNQL